MQDELLYRVHLPSQQLNRQELATTTNTAETTVLWPRDLLPNVVHDARIFTWGYDADIDGFGSASQSTIYQHASSLLSDIADQREKSPCYRAPILFVVHSLGGIVVKAALNRSSATQGTRLKDITPSTFGVCFLGTPHRGSQSASLGKIAFEVTRVMTRRPNTMLLRGLERNSETLEQIGDTFAQTMLTSETKLRVYSFREEKETRKYLVFNTMVVEPDSAKIGDAHEEVGSIPANHSQMTKFEGSEDIGFKRVAAQLRRWVRELRVNEEIFLADIVDCMASLSIPETKFRIVDVRKAYKATFDWLFKPDVVPYSDWLRQGIEKDQPFFWIQGKPGSGKSTLMKFAMRDPRTTALLGDTSDSAPSWTLVAFFFHDRGSSIQKSLLGLLREVVDSTLRQLPQLMPHAIAVYKVLVKSQRKNQPDWHFEALRDVMERITEQRETRVKLLLFLDALDEHKGDNDLLLQMLKEWTQNVDGYYVTLKICLASRSWPVFTQQFEMGPNFAIDHFTKDDIRIYTESRLSSSHGGLAPRLKTESLDFLVEKIMTKARGVFIWVRLVADRLVENIRDGTPFHVLSRIIAETPEELQELYDDTLRRINLQYANETHVMFQMVLCSVARLPLETLVEATVMSLDRYLDGNICLGSESGSNNLSFPQAQRWLISRSGGLLEVYTEANVDRKGEADAPIQYVQFLHQTSKEYIQSPRAQAVLERMAPEVAGKDGFYFLSLASQSCSAWVAPIKLQMLYYIKLTELHGQIDEHIDIPLDDDSGTADPANNPCGFKWWLQQQEDPWLDQLYGKGPTNRDFYGRILRPDLLPYHFLLLVVAANLISMVPNACWPNTFDRGNQDPVTCPLQLAIGGPNIVPAELQDRVAMVEKLLSSGYPPDHRTPIPPHLAGSRKPDHSTYHKTHAIRYTAVEYLLYGFGMVRLADKTRICILNALFDAGADPKETSHPFGQKFWALDEIYKGRSGLPPISHSVLYEPAAIVRTLLQRGVPMDVRDATGWLPIDYALLRRDREILAAFNDRLPEPVRPDLGMSQDPAAFPSGTLTLLSTTMYTALGHPGLSILLARCENQEDCRRLKEERERKEYEGRLDGQRVNLGPA
ncbi:MAG: hypothetical protein LQ349_007898 [Xanthoria aureola]|nr:MAG: hypothetical protein LQ349_007898 [Xanthoria aureola]